MDATIPRYATATTDCVVPWPTQSTRGSVSNLGVRASSFPELRLGTLASQLLLRGRIAPGWMIVQPLPLLLEQDDDGSFLVSDDLFAVYGEGSVAVEALQDYIVSLIDYYQLLTARAAEYDPPAQALLRHLRLYLHHHAGD
jgi:hypothetical protein